MEIIKDIVSEDVFVMEMLLAWRRSSRDDMLHFHEEHHEFFFCVEGRGVQLLKGKVVRMSPGEFFMFPSGQLHMGCSVEDKRCRGYVINIRDSVLQKLAGEEPEFGKIFSMLRQRALSGKIRIRLNTESARAIKLVFEELILENTERSIGYSLAIRTSTEKLLLAILRNYRKKIGLKKKFRASPEEKIDNFCNFLEANYMYDINVEQAAKMTGFSRSHFHTMFSARKGARFVNYLNAIRISRAINMLKDTDLSLESISSSCGFKSLSHFYLVFRTGTGKKPNDFRK